MSEFYSSNEPLTQAQMETNARYIYNYLGSRGWSTQAIAGMLGNMEHESTINPGRWQSGNVGVGPAYGLVQWDPFSKYIDWCDGEGIDPAHMDSALKRIEYELANGIQYYSTPEYPLSFADFKVSKADPAYLAWAFIYNYERPAVKNQPNRATSATKWYSFLTGEPAPSDPVTPTPTPDKDKKKGLSLLLMAIATRK